jgi:hypothetical protein
MTKNVPAFENRVYVNNRSEICFFVEIHLSEKSSENGFVPNKPNTDKLLPWFYLEA